MVRVTASKTAGCDFPQQKVEILEVVKVKKHKDTSQVAPRLDTVQMCRSFMSSELER